MKSARDIAGIALTVALLICGQLLLSAVPGVEVVTLIFVAYSFVFGRIRGMVVATIFSLVRQFIFGLWPTVLILYLVYYNFLALVMGTLGVVLKNKREIVKIVWVTIVAVVSTVMFTMIDNVITPLFYGYSLQTAIAYFYSSLTFMIPQIICVGISVGILFMPLSKVFLILKSK